MNPGNSSDAGTFFANEQIAENKNREIANEHRRGERNPMEKRT